MTLETAAKELLENRPEMRQDQGKAFVAIYYMFKLADNEGKIGIEAFNKIKPDSVVRALRTAKENHDTFFLNPKNNGICPCPVNCGKKWRTKKNEEDAGRIRLEKSYREMHSTLPRNEASISKGIKAQEEAKNATEGNTGANMAIPVGRLSHAERMELIKKGVGDKIRL